MSIYKSNDKQKILVVMYLLKTLQTSFNKLIHIIPIKYIFINMFFSCNLNKPLFLNTRETFQSISPPDSRGDTQQSITISRDLFSTRRLLGTARVVGEANFSLIPCLDVIGVGRALRLCRGKYLSMYRRHI